MVTPVDADRLEYLLVESGYDKDKMDELIRGFKYGFSIGYAGKCVTKRTAPNLKLRVGNETILWNKVMKEVREGRYVGPIKIHLLRILFNHRLVLSRKTVERRQG